jgi:UPF0042 nucleotide-binding protein
MDVAPEVAIITGLSGAGRSTAAKCLEDLGWYVVDNLPPALLPTLADLGGRARGGVPRIAAGVDIRSLEFFADLREALDALGQQGIRPRILFLEASDEVLVRRFESVRRPHPLQEERGHTGRLTDGIARERQMLADLRGSADLVVDTSNLTIHQLRADIEAAFGTPNGTRLRATVLSFGFKYGLPADADLVLDCRFLPNPHWEPELQPLTGRDAPVRDFVLGAEGASELRAEYGKVLDIIEAGYAREGKRFLTLAVGCTGGKHRSVAMAEALGEDLTADGADVRIVHRDLGRE